MPEPADLPVRATTPARVAGDDPVEATRVIRAELGDPHLVPLVEAEGLPGTGPMARTAVHLQGLPVALTPHGWRLTGSRAGTDLAARRAWAQHESLLGATADVLAGAPAGPTLVRILGPATLAARLALPSGEPALSDPGAVRDLTQTWVESMASLAAATASALPGAEPVLDVLEPDLEDVTAGRVRSSSGYRRLPAWELDEPGQAWVRLLRTSRCILPLPALGVAGLREAAPAEPTGADPDSTAPRVAVRLPAPGTPEGYVPVADWVEAGHHVVLRLPDEPGPVPRVAEAALAVARPWRGLGLTADHLGRLVIEAGSGSALTPGRLAAAAVRARDIADALDQVRHDDLGSIS